MFPRKVAFVDAATTFTGSELAIGSNLKHYGEVTAVAYFSADAVGSVTVSAKGGDVLFTLPAAAGAKTQRTIAGFQLGDIDTLTLDETGLTAGSVQVSIF